MVIEKLIPDFLVWLLGPGWREGALFHPAVLAIVLLAALGAIALLALTARQGRRGAARGAAYVLAGAALLAIGVLAVVMRGNALLAGVKTIEADGVSHYVDKATGEPVSAMTGLVLAMSRGLVAAGAWLLGDGWAEGTLYQWIAVASILGIGALLVGVLMAILRRGPGAGVKAVDETLTDLVVELVRISPRRVWALTRLGIQESIRRRVVVGFALFIVVLLFAGWFLDTRSVNPSQLYLNFVLTTTSYLVLLLALFLSTFSLPGDIRSKTLHTVVTKPVRSSEIVLGRMLGFVLVGTGLLAVMAAVSYVFVLRGLSHTHELDAEALAEAKARAGSRAELDLLTSRVHNHRHPVHVDAEGHPTLGTENGHWHEIAAGDDGSYTIGGQQGDLVARVPVYGKLRFLDRRGQPTDKGINVGDEWTYRSYIEGGTSCAAIWIFDGITEERFPDGIPVEMTLGVFRTWKGDIEKGILGSISVRNPETGLTKEVTLFTAKEFRVDSHFVPREVKGLDLYENFVAGGKLEIVLRCLSPAQFYGVSKADVYLRAGDAWFETNFLKGYLGIWLQMVLVIGLGVTFSTFLSGPVAMVATAGSLVLGFFSDFMLRLATGQTYGGGPVESLIRLWTQDNVISEMEPSPRTTAAKMMDTVFSGPLWVMSKLLPPFGEFSTASYVADGYNVSGAMVWAHSCQAFGFLLPLFVLGYLFLKTREVAK